MACADTSIVLHALPRALVLRILRYDCVLGGEGEVVERMVVGERAES